MPVGAYGLSADLAAALAGRADLDLVDMGGVGGTLAGNALSVAAARATLDEVLTDEAFAGMIAVADAFAAGITKIIEAYAPAVVRQPARRTRGIPVHVPAPRTGGESAGHADPELEDYLHAYLANRGVLLTPFHNMALMCPQTTPADVASHHEVFADALGELAG